MWKKIVLFVISGILFYGMLISGTRGALFTLIVGAFFAIALSKNYKILISGTIAALAFLAFLKFTTIGNGHYEIYRLRTALDPQDASLNVRYLNQQILRDYLSTRPFGGGLGVIGNWGETYNKGNFLSTIPPDSYWVKVWAMYGIVGLTLWFGMIMYIIGKCSGIIWKIKNAGLRYKLIALCAGTAGIFFASYGNEIINDMPSAMIVYLSWVFIYMGPKWDKQLLTNTNED
jgi:O-antigen ligase